MAVAQVNAAIGMDILLRSFIARPDGNHGQVNETYDLDLLFIKAAHPELQRLGKVDADGKSADRHDLLTLFLSVPKAVRSRVGLNQEQEWIERYRNAFRNARYPYEDKSSGGYDDILLDVLGRLIRQVVE